MRRNWIWLVLGSFIGMVFCAQAQSLDGIKQRMLDRKPAVDRLLSSKALGENNAGYLEVLGKMPDADKKVVEAENADRKAVYGAIAAKSGATADFVGQQRAAAIGEKAKAGTMIQSKDGKWAEKR